MHHKPQHNTPGSTLLCPAGLVGAAHPHSPLAPPLQCCWDRPVRQQQNMRSTSYVPLSLPSYMP